MTEIALQVNGGSPRLEIDTRTTLLDLLRERLGLTGAKKGCDHGQCGACTVLLDGRRVNACLALAVAHDGAEVITVEGLADGDELHPLQAAFIEHDALPVRLLHARARSARRSACSTRSARLAERASPTTWPAPALDDAEIRERMSGNLCRCGAYAEHRRRRSREAAPMRPFALRARRRRRRRGRRAGRPSPARRSSAAAPTSST